MLLSLIPKVMLNVSLVLLGFFTDVLEKKLINLVQKLKSLTQKSKNYRIFARSRPSNNEVPHD